VNIIVCVKQVPSSSEVRINPETHSIDRGSAESIVNPFDENAVEEALRLREKYGGTVTCISMGPPQAESALRHCLGMGADEAVLLCDRRMALADTWATSYTLAQAIKSIGNYDLIICGKQTFDGDTGQVGPGLAEQLGIPQITYAIEVTAEDGKLTVKRLLEDEFEIVETRLPALITVVKQINDPRYPSMKNLLKAKKKQVPTWDADAIGADLNQVGLNGSPTVVVRSFTPERHRETMIIEGEPRDAARDLAEKILALNLPRP
jgi:electron transfer flavoprotein beta subunit